MGRSDEAIAVIRQALQIDPLSLVLHHYASRVYFLARCYDQVIALCREALDMEPNFALCAIWLGLACTEKEMHEEALTCMKKARESFVGVPFTMGFLGHAYARAGRRADAEDVLQQLLKPDQQFYADRYEVSVIQVGLGELERALNSLEEAYQERSQFLTFFARCDPRLDPLRSDARFKELLRRFGLPP
jgi:tetratricopeptide (TPR) repeat protein